MSSVTKLFFSLLFIFILSANSFAADISQEEEFEKIEAFYEKGDYEAGLKSVALLIGKLKDKPTENPSLARAYFLNAILSDAMSQFDQYKNYMEMGMKSLGTANANNVVEYNKALEAAVDAYSAVGEYKKAEDVMLKVKEALDKASVKDVVFLNQYKIRMARVYFNQGYQLKANNLLPELLDYYKKRIVLSESVWDEKKKANVDKKLPGKELKARQSQYARLVNFKAEIFMENGNYTTADSLLSANILWINDNMGGSDIAEVDALYMKGELNEIKGNPLEANNYYKKASATLISTSYKPTSKQAVKIYERLVPTFTATNQATDADKNKLIFEAGIKRYYGTENSVYGKLMIMEAENMILDKDYEDAAKKLEGILANKLYFPTVHPERARMLMLLTDVYIKTDQYNKAEAAITKATDIKKTLMGENAPAYHMQLLDLANYYVLYGENFAEAEKIYNNSLEKIIKKEIDHQHVKYIPYLYQESKLYELTDRYDQAKAIIKEASDEVAKQNGTSSLRYAIALEKMANVDILQGLYREAQKKLDNSLALFKEKALPIDNLDYSHSLETLAKLQIIQGEYEDAESTLKKANLLTRRADSDLLKISTAAEELAILYIYTGKYQSTEKTLKQSIALKEEKFGPNYRNLIKPINTLGRLYFVTGDYTQAEKLGTRAANLSIKIFGESSIKNAESLKLLMNVYSAIGDYQKAEDAGNKVIKIQESQYGRNHIQVALSLNELALVKYYNNKDKKEINDLFLEALKIIKENLNEDNPQYAEVSKNLALFYVETGRIDEASALLEKANKIWIKKFGTQNVHSAEIAFLRGNIEFKKKKFSEALAFYISSRDAYKSIFDASHPDYVRSQSKCGQTYFTLGDSKNAVKSYDEVTQVYLTYLQKYFPALSEGQKASFWKVIKSDFEFYNTLAIKLKNEYPLMIGNVYNFTLATKALLLNSSIKVRQRILQSKDTSLIKKYEKWMNKRESITAALSMSSEQRKQDGIDIKVLEKETETLEKSLSESSEVFASNYEKNTGYDWKTVKDALAPNEVALEIIRFRYFDKGFTDSIIYAAMAVSPESKAGPDLVLMNNGSLMEKKFVKYYRNVIKFKLEDQMSYEMFWKPIKTLVKDGAKVYLSPDGVYNQINVETLLTPDNGYVINKNEIVVVSNTKDLIARKTQMENDKKKKAVPAAANVKVDLYGNPDYYPATAKSINENSDKTKISQLPGSEKEVKNLFDLLKSKGWNASLFLNDDASEENIKKMKSPKVFHVATHGFFMEDVSSNGAAEGLNENKAAQNPLLRSGLIMKNGGYLLYADNVYDYNSEEGILTAYEAMNLDLDNTDLVVLSACETGLGEVQLGEGVYGLQRSFLVAGAGSIVMSLFKVSDEVTNELMSTFYKKWISGMEKRKAFLEAKKEIMVKFKDPIYWGSFVMIGLE
jgi:CHAT domain-containing protein/tetratricopeptide (TPR) repeat protein